MIFFQIIASILLVPLTLLMLLLFNVYLMHRVCLLFILLFGLIYSYLWCLVFLNPKATLWVLMVLTIFYIIRMIFLTYKVRSKNNSNTPFVRANIKSKKDKFHIIFLFPLSFLNIFKLLPRFIRREITIKTRQNIEINEFMELILACSIGTRIEVVDDENDIYFEIQ